MPGVSNTPLLSSTSEDENKLYITAEETVESEEVKVKGRIPSFISGGKYLRVGPSKFDFPEFTMKHWLDGYAMLAKFEIKDDTIAFDKKYLETDVYKRAVAQGKPVVNEFATKAVVDSKKGFFARVISTLLPEFTDNSYSTLFQLGTDLFSTCDTQYFHKINSSGLSIDCKCDASKLFGVNGHCAHPVTDANGDVYNTGFTLGATGIKYHIYKVPYAKTSDEMMKKAKTLTTFSPRNSGQLGASHSFGITENYLIIIEQPYTVSTKRIAASFVKGDVLKDWLEWRPEEKNRFYVIEKSSGKVFKTEFLTSTAFYYLHFINCYEESNQIIVDIITYDSPNVLDAMFVSPLRKNNSEDLPLDFPCPQRFVLPIIPDLKVANIRENLNLVNDIDTTCTAIRNGNKIIISGEKLPRFGIDLPTTNKRFFGRKTRYVYAVGVLLKEHEFLNSVCKIDLDTKEVLKWKNCEHTFPGEPLFVPDPKGTKEDDGVLIVALTDKRQGHEDSLVILDARNLTEICRASFKNHVPAALHGIFLPN